MKKILSIILALLMLMTLVPVAISAAVGDVSADYTPAESSTAISSWADFLSAVAKEEGNMQSYHLTGDIAVDSTCPIAFSGILDGCGHTVTVSEPMFADFNGTIKNMKLTGSITKTDGSNAAAVALTSTEGMTASNITSDVDITVTYDSDKNRTVEGLYGAGIVCDSWYCTFTNVVNTGDITVDLKYYENAILVDGNGNSVPDADNPTQKPRAGGLAAITDNAYFTNCVNYGKVTCSGYKGIAGGISARTALAKSTTTVRFEHCVNNGNVVATGEGTEAGGIAAYSGTGEIYVWHCFFGCVNTGDITAGARAGGLAAYVYGSGDSQRAIVEFFINTGSITGSTNCASPFIGYSNTKHTVLAFNIDIGTLAKSGEEEANMHSALITFNKTQPNPEKMVSNHISGYETKFDYLVYTANTSYTDKIIAISAVKEKYSTSISDVKLDDLKSETYLNAINAIADEDGASFQSTYRYIKSDILPIVETGASWTYSEGKYTYTPAISWMVRKYNPTNGSLTVSKTHAAAGEEVIFTATPDEGYGIDYISVWNDIGYGLTITNNSFVMPMSNVIISVSFAEPVATVTDKDGKLIENCGSLEWAINVAKANEGSTIKLVADITDRHFNIDGGTFTIDLNGNDISYKETAPVFAVSNGANVTFVDTNTSGTAGTVSNSNSKRNAVRVNFGSTVTINGGKFYGGKYAVIANAGSTVTLNGGEYIGGTYAIYINSEDTNEDGSIIPAASLTINGGTFSTNGSRTVRNNGHLVINDGDFTSGSASALYVFGTSSTVINGGNFTSGTQGHFCYNSGTLDLSNYEGTKNIDELTVYCSKNNSLIPALPTGYGFFDNGVEVIAFSEDILYTIGLKKSYNIKVAEGIENGTLTTSVSSSYAGEEVTLTATPATGYALSELIFTDANGKPIELTVSDGKFIMPVGDVTVTAVFDQIFATLTDKDGNLVGKYATVQAAINAAADYEGSTVKLVDDVELASICTIYEGTFTFDLNGCDITFATGHVFRLYEGVNVTFTDNSTGEAGKVTSGASYYAIYADLGSTVTVDGGEYEGRYAIYIRSDWMDGDVVKKPGASATINGGTFISTNTATIGNGCSLEINGGKFYAGSRYAINTTSGTKSTVINGGEFLPNAAGDSFDTVYYYQAIDFSNYDGVTPITDITLYCGSADAAMPSLPAGYCLYLDGEEVEALTVRETYSIDLKVYTVTTPAESEIGSVVADAETATMGTEVTLTVNMVDEYVLDTLIVNGTNVAAQVEGGQYTFDMPAADVTVSVTFKLRKAVVFMNGEEEWEKVLASENGTILFAGMPAPTKDGCDFAGWFTADGVLVYHGMSVNEDMTAFATWLTVKSAENGELSYSKAGAEVTVTATPADGYELDTLTVTDAAGNPIEVTDGKFTLTGSDVTVSATFKKTVYTVTVNPSMFGKVTANKTTVKAGDTVTLTITPDHEYALASLVVRDAAGNEVKLNGYSFVMPESNVTVTATFEEIKIHPVSIYFKGNVKLEGGELASGSCKFVLEDETGRVIETVKCDENGDFEFKPVSFYGPVDNYRFTLTQIIGDEAGVTYDEKVHEVYVTVINPGDGYLEAEIIGSLESEFINKYTAPEVSE